MKVFLTLHFLLWFVVMNADLSNGKNSVESQDPYNCTSSEWRCPNSTVCILKAYKCDGYTDCPDEADETNCPPKECSSREWNCPNTSRCIRKLRVCDGSSDCAEGADELNCQEWECPSGRFKCPESGICIRLYLRCDGSDHCSRGEDELDCENTKCWSNRIKCADNKQCIDPRDRCDQKSDCNDGSDERGCFDCGRRQAMCTDSKGCIDIGSVCNGYHDCSDGSDEIFCNKDEADFNELTFQSLGFRNISKDFCAFGLKGQFCNETCTECLSPYCNENVLDPDNFEVRLQNDISCVPNSSYALTLKDTNFKSMKSSLLSLVATQLVFLKFSNVTFDEVDPNFLENTALSYLYLNNASLSSESGIYFDIPSLVQLNLDFNRFTSIPYLGGAGRLRLISLNLNRLHRLRARAFGIHHSLAAIYLRRNRIIELHRDALDGLYNLQVLDLTGNYISYFEPDFFSKLRKLDSLYLSGNSITRMPSLSGVSSEMTALMSFNFTCSDFEGNENWTCQRFPSHHMHALFLLSDSRNHCDGISCSNNWTCLNVLNGHHCQKPDQCSCQTFGAFIHHWCETTLKNVDGSRQDGCNVNCSCSGSTFSCQGSLEVIDSSRLCVQNITEARFDNVGWSDQDLAVVLDGMPSLKSLTLVNQNATQISQFLRYFLSRGRWNLIKNLTVTNSELTDIPYGLLNVTAKLERLILRGNIIKRVLRIPSRTIEVLDLSHNRIKTVAEDAFATLTKLRVVDLSHNFIGEFSGNSFNGLVRLQVLDLSSNKVTFYPLDLLKHQNNLITVKGDDFVICCLAQKFSSATLRECEPQDPISSCDRLISQDHIRAFIWMQALVALSMNIAVLIMRIREYSGQTSNGKKLNILYLAVLSIADMCMGFFLILIAVVDSVFSENYFAQANSWRKSTLCKFSGVLSLFSAQASVFTLLIITITRMLSVVYPLIYLTLNATLFRSLLAGVWLIALLISMFPLGPFENFYGSSSLCLPSFYADTSDDTWPYSVFVVALNFIAFLVILVLYVTLFLSTTRSRFDSDSRKSGGVELKQKLGRRVFLIVATDFCCWVPICVIGFVSLAKGGLSYYNEIYPWTAVLLLPINSAMNPIIYTFLTRKPRCQNLYIKRPNTRSTSLK